MPHFTKSDEQNLVSVLYNFSFFEKAPAGFNVAGGSRAIRQGDILAFDAANAAKNLIVLKATRLTAAITNASTTITVRDAHPFAVGDTIDFETGASAVATAINYDTNVITVAVAGSNASGDTILSGTTVETQPIGVALLPLMAENEHYDRLGLTPPNAQQYGDIALTGLFKMSALRNFQIHAKDQAYNGFRRIGTSENSERAGRESFVHPDGDPVGVFALYTPSQYFFV